LRTAEKRIQRYVEKLAVDPKNTFGGSLQLFIECTIDAEGSDPRVVVRNVRQFLNGMKNYLVKNGEANLLELIEQESAKLRSNEFLNIDAILEAVLHKIVLGMRSNFINQAYLFFPVPIKPHIYHLMCRDNIKNGSFETLTANLSKIRVTPIEQLGFSASTKLPDMKRMEQLRVLIRKMQNHYSPLKKLEYLLKALSIVITRPPSTPTLIRWLVFILAKTSSVTCEIETYYMFELLPQQLLTIDATYHLAALFSAVQILKNPDTIGKLKYMSNHPPDFSTPNTILQSCLDEAACAYFR
jgi:hypothetical protein